MLITGAGGQLGTDLVSHFTATGTAVTPLDRSALDITDPISVDKAIEAAAPTVVVHAAAYTAVDACETETEHAWSVNATGSWNVARACREQGATMVYISTDYVFDGSIGRPYTEFDRTCPVSMYGRTKEAGEQKVRETLAEHYIVRTSWVHGSMGGNFAKTMLRLGRERESVSVVDDQTGSPTFTDDLSAQIDVLLQTDAFGTYHLTNTGHCTWFEFARMIFELADVDVDLKPTDTASFGAPAPRPAFSVLDNLMSRQVGLPAMPAWEDSLARLVDQIA